MSRFRHCQTCTSSRHPCGRIKCLVCISLISLVTGQSTSPVVLRYQRVARRLDSGQFWGDGALGDRGAQNGVSTFAGGICWRQGAHSVFHKRCAYFQVHLKSRRARKVRCPSWGCDFARPHSVSYVMSPILLSWQTTAPEGRRAGAGAQGQGRET